MRFFRILAVLTVACSFSNTAAETEKGPRIEPARDPRLLTIDEAVAISERTGRPIFAVAGNAT